MCMNLISLFNLLYSTILLLYVALYALSRWHFVILKLFSCLLIWFENVPHFLNHNCILDNILKFFV